MEHVINWRAKSLAIGSVSLAAGFWTYRTYVALTTPAPTPKANLEQVPSKQSPQTLALNESIPKNPLQDFFDQQLLTIEKICKLFDLKVSDLIKIRESWVEEMKLGLETTGRSSFQMIPSYVPVLATGNEKGSFMALDIGGTNYRISEIKIQGEGILEVGRKDHVQIPQRLLSGSSEELFDFFAQSVKNFVQNNNETSSSEIGFTFSFPVQQTGIASGKLIKWTKEFNTSGVEGKDVVALLHAGFQRKGLSSDLHVEALVNDTVGTLLASSYLHPEKPTLVALIIGTGTNLAYYESMDRLKKWKQDVPESGKMVINMESGNFDSLKKTALPRTEIDKTLDAESTNPGNQFFEKMISGRYLGEIFRLTLNLLTKNKYILPNPNVSSLFEGKYSIDTQVMSQLQGDETEELTGIESWLITCGINWSTVLDRIIIKRLCVAISARAAYLTAMAITGVLTHLELNPESHVIVAVDGSVFEKYTNFANVLGSMIRELGFKNVELRLTTDGSSTGAAVTAAVISTLSADQKRILQDHSDAPNSQTQAPKSESVSEQTTNTHQTESSVSHHESVDSEPAHKTPVVHTDSGHVEPAHTEPVVESSHSALHSTPEHSEPVHSEPTHSEPAHPKPVHSESTHSEPVHLESTHSEPVHSDSTHSEPVHSEPTHSEPSHSEPTHSEPSHSEPTHSEPSHSEPTHSEPSHSEPTHSEPSHSEPTHSEPSHSEPTHSEPSHSEPTHSEPVHSNPVHDEPTHSEPTHSEQTHPEPTHPEPVDSESSHSEPSAHSDSSHPDSAHQDSEPIHTEHQGEIQDSDSD